MVVCLAARPQTNLVTICDINKVPQYGGMPGCKASDKPCDCLRHKQSAPVWWYAWL